MSYIKLKYEYMLLSFYEDKLKSKQLILSKPAFPKLRVMSPKVIGSRFKF